PLEPRPLRDIATVLLAEARFAVPCRVGRAAARSRLLGKSPPGCSLCALAGTAISLIRIARSFRHGVAMLQQRRTECSRRRCGVDNGRDLSPGGTKSYGL